MRVRGQVCEHWVSGAPQAWIEHLGFKNLLANFELGKGSPMIGLNVDLVPLWE